MNTSNQPLTLEQRIFIAADHNPEKVKVINDIIEEAAKKFTLHICGSFEFPKEKISYSKGSLEDILIHLPATIDKRYSLYQQTNNYP